MSTPVQIMLVVGGLFSGVGFIVGVCGNARGWLVAGIGVAMLIVGLYGYARG